MKLNLKIIPRMHACMHAHFRSRLCLDKSFPARIFERVCVLKIQYLTQSAGVLHGCGFEDYLHFLKLILIAWNFSDTLHELCQDERHTI